MIHQFNNDDFVTVASVPVLDEHVLTARDGDVEAVVDAAFLEDVAENCNGRFATTGDAVPLVLGHTVPNAPETEQPPIVGYATNFRVGDFNDTGRQAIYCDFHVRREHENALRDYPRRSVELWVRKREIDPISLLGATTPERDLGILRYSRKADTLHYARECPTMQKPTQYAADDSDPVKDAEKNESSGNREISSKLDKLMEMLAPLVQLLSEAPPAEGADADGGVGEGAEDGEPESEPGGEDDGDEMNDDDLLGPDGGEDAEADVDPSQQPQPQPQPGGEKKEAAKFRDNPVRFGSSVGGNNSSLPTVTKMQRKDDDVVKLQRQHDSLAREHADLKLKYSRLEAEKKVADLEAEGYQFADRSEDVEMLARLDDKMRAKFVEKIKKNYRREAVAVGTGELHRYSREQIGKDEKGPKTNDDVQRAISEQKFTSVEEAYQKLWGSK